MTGSLSRAYCSAAAAAGAAVAFRPEDDAWTPAADFGADPGAGADADRLTYSARSWTKTRKGSVLALLACHSCSALFWY